MAYDLRRIGAEKVVPPFKPAWKWWLLLFVPVVGGSSFFVVSTWPTGSSTNTPWFWSCAVVFPLLAWLIPFLVYLGALQERRHEAMDHNEDRDGRIRQTQIEGGVPLHVLASGFVFSEQEHENSPLALISKELKLESRSRYVGDNQTFDARWIEPSGHGWLPGEASADLARQKDVFRFVADSLIDQIAPAVKSLPEYVRVHTEIGVDTLLDTASVEHIWHDAWTSKGLGVMTAPVVLNSTPALIDVDKWLDDSAAFEPNAIKILCSVRLGTLLNTPPTAKAAEAGAVIMLATAPLVARKRLKSEALFYRPERSSETDLSQKLSQTLFWSKARGEELEDHWFTGGSEAPLQRALVSHLDAQKFAVAKSAELKGHHDLDLRIGKTNSVAPWLSIALAASYARICSRKQLISVAGDDSLTMVVVAPRI